MIDPFACERGAIAACQPARDLPVNYWPVLGLVVGPGVVPGVGLVVLGVSVPVPPAAPELIPDELLPDVPPPDVPPLGELPESEGMVEEPELELPLLLPDAPEPVLPPEPPPVGPEHATISIAQATDIIHLVIDHSR